MKKLFALLSLLCLSVFVFAQTLEAEYLQNYLNLSSDYQEDDSAMILINQIENYKTELENFRNENTPESEEELAAFSEAEKLITIPLNSTYDELENATFTISSFSQNMKLSYSKLNVETGNWELQINADLFGQTDIFNELVYLSYQDITGVKAPNQAKMTKEERQIYNTNVETYDSLFENEVPVLCVKVSYKILKWREASQYHFIPQKCEVIHLGRKNKTIKTISKEEMSPVNFSLEPAVEIRSQQQIAKDNERADKYYAKEVKNKDLQKKKKAMANVKKYNDAYNPSLNNSNSNDRTTMPVNTKPEKTWVGRNTVYLSTSYNFSNLSKNDYFDGTDFTEPTIWNFDAGFTFNLSKMFYLGFSAGLQKWNYGEVYDKVPSSVQDDLDNLVFYGKLQDGLVLNCFNHFRPFAEAGIAYYGTPYNFINYNLELKKKDNSHANISALEPDTDGIIGLSLGGGIDIIPARKFFISIVYTYNWMYYLNSFKKSYVENEGTFGPILKTIAAPDFRTMQTSVGIGLTF